MSGYEFTVSEQEKYDEVIRLINQYLDGFPKSKQHLIDAFDDFVDEIMIKQIDWDF